VPLAHGQREERVGADLTALEPNAVAQWLNTEQELVASKYDRTQAKDAVRSAINPACTIATLSVTVVEHLKKGRVTAVTAKQKKTTGTIVIGGGKIFLAAGAHQTLSFAINAAGRALLARFGKLSAVATVSSGGRVISRTTIHLLKPTPAKKKQK
jgi:hypothetical protein